MSFLNVEALCPYYKYEKTNILHCEIGNISFLDKQMKIDIGYTYCGYKYDECPFKIALDKYYERKPEGSE